MRICGTYLERYLKIDINFKWWIINHYILSRDFLPALLDPQVFLFQILPIYVFSLRFVWFWVFLWSTKKDLSTCLKVCFYLRAILPSCAVYSTSSWSPTIETSKISLGSNTKLQITSCGSFKREPCLDSTITQKVWGAPVVLEDISPDSLSISSLTHWLTSGKSHHPHLPPFPPSQTFRGVLALSGRKFKMNPQNQNKLFGFKYPKLEFCLL